MKSEREQARAQFLYESEWREKILSSPKGKKRAEAFTDAYFGLAKGIASHKFVNKEQQPGKKAKQKFRLLKRFLTPSTIAAELGPGELHLARIVAPKIQALALVDVVKHRAWLPKSCTSFVGDGVSLPKEVKKLDLVWSSHVVEHIHPDSLLEHMKSVCSSLVPGGKYVVFTPNRFSGPHDISRQFLRIAGGLHLKEYTVHELRDVLRAAGFKKVSSYAGGKGVYLRSPIFLPIFIEYVLSRLPQAICRPIASFLPIKAILGIILVGKK